MLIRLGLIYASIVSAGILSALPNKGAAEVFPARTYEQLCRDIAELDLPIQPGIGDDVPAPLATLMGDAEFTATPDAYDLWGNVYLSLNIRILSETEPSEGLMFKFLEDAAKVRQHYDRIDAEGSLWAFEGRHGWRVVVVQSPRQDEHDILVRCEYVENAPHIQERVLDEIRRSGFHNVPENTDTYSYTNGIHMALMGDGNSLLTIAITEDDAALSELFPTYDGMLWLSYAIFPKVQ